MSTAPSQMQVGGLSIPVHSTNTLVIGSGAAALNAVVQLVAQGQRDVLIVTERWGAGTSFEAGSDKQTYYKLSLAHAAVDAPRQMAEDLFRGGSMHGDLALCEAQHSAQAFYHLVSLGVPFPHDRYGAYVGYRTDHDPRGRATSAGPLTSRLMCECLGRAVRQAGIPVLDEHQVIALLTHDGTGGRCVCGAVALDKRRLSAREFGLVVFNAVNVVLATGGPGGLYRASVYPESQHGAIGLALAVGAAANNLTESQFGLAALPVRWNVSGSYQQVIPRYISTDAHGGDRREFLNEHFPDLRSLTTATFRKGYEWPFDCERVRGHGSSLIDLLVYRETTQRGRRVFLDFAHNPGEANMAQVLAPERLDPEAYAYLQNSRALLATPVERLRAMNAPAYEFFRGRGIDLADTPLEIAVCAQHNNGGLRGNIWWESNIRHLFPIGEVNGTHGVRRPGGAALNAGQVGGLRAALHIARRHTQSPPDSAAFTARIGGQVERCLARARHLLRGDAAGGLAPAAVLEEIQDRMSTCAGILRAAEPVARAADAAWSLHARVGRELVVARPAALPVAFQALELCLTHAVFLEALREYLAQGGRSRGSYLVLDAHGDPPAATFGGEWRFDVEKAGSATSTRILEVHLDDGLGVHKHWVDIRPIPEVQGWFETVWSDYVNDRVIRTEEA